MCQSRFSPSTTRAPGVNLRSSNLTASAFTTEPSHQPVIEIISQKYAIINQINVVPGVEHRALCVLGECSTIKLSIAFSGSHFIGLNIF